MCLYECKVFMLLNNYGVIFIPHESATAILSSFFGYGGIKACMAALPFTTLVSQSSPASLALATLTLANPSVLWISLTASYIWWRKSSTISGSSLSIEPNHLPSTFETTSFISSAFKEAPAASPSPASFCTA